MKKKVKRKTVYKKQQAKFTAMSKLIGIVIAFLVITVLIFSMYEMHRLHDLSSLSQLLIGTFAVLTTYIGFYINMAKAEHIEDKKNQIKKELELIRANGITVEEQEKQEQLQQQLEQMNIDLDIIKSQE